MSEFRVGEKVVCIGAFTKDMHPLEISPTVGEVYTVRAVRPSRHGDFLVLRLREIVNPKLRYNGELTECWFCSQKFRPVQHQSKSIEIFRKIARDVTEGKKVRISA